MIMNHCALLLMLCLQLIKEIFCVQRQQQSLFVHLYDVYSSAVHFFLKPERMHPLKAKL